MNLQNIGGNVVLPTPLKIWLLISIVVLKFESIVKISSVWWRHHFEDNETMKFSISCNKNTLWRHWKDECSSQTKIKDAVFSIFKVLSFLFLLFFFQLSIYIPLAWKLYVYLWCNQTITQKMADQGRSDLDVVSTMILFGIDFFIW